MKSKLLYIATFAFFSGVFFASLIDLSRDLALLICLIGTALMLSSLIFQNRDTPAYVHTLFIAGLMFIFVGLGVFRMSIVDSTQTLVEYTGDTVEYRGIISDEPEMRDTTQRFTADISVHERGNLEKILVIADRYPEYGYGDELVLTGKLRTPENFETYAGGPIFDYVSYLYKDGIGYTMYRPKIELVGEGRGNPIIALLYEIKHSFSRSVERAMSEPESSLLLGLLTGEKSSLGKELLDDFRTSGLSHIIVLSGYNVTIVAEYLMRVFSYISVSASPLFGVFSIVLFALMTGASATTVRASIMALLFIFSRRISRRYDVSRALVFAAFLMVIHNPRILVFDVSFQLSVLATIAIIYVAPLIRERIPFITERYMLRDVVSATIGTQLFVLPYILHVMGTLSLVSIVSNVLVLPIVPFAMLSGFVTGAVGLIAPLIATPLGWLSDIVLAYILGVARISASIPLASLEISLPLFATVLLYVIFSAVLIRIYKRRSSSGDERLKRALF